MRVYGVLKDAESLMSDALYSTIKLMRVARSTAATQRRMLDSRLIQLRSLAGFPPPRSGWIKAIRGALGITSRQLGVRVGTTHQVIVRQEERETKGAVTLDSLDRTARAMGCRLVYALVPEAQYGSLEGILDHRARSLARTLATAVAHSMRLESQGVDATDTEAQVESLAQELKAKLDPRLWAK